MVARREVESLRLSHPTEFPRILLAALGNFGVDEVGERREGLVEVRPRIGEFGLQLGDDAFQSSPFGSVCFASLGRQLLLARLLMLVSAGGRPR